MAQHLFLLLMEIIGALLDRNGLRPSRYTVTKDGYVVMSSETGVTEIEPKNVAKHGRLEPGRMFLVDMNEGRIVEDKEIKGIISSKHPYQDWLDDNLLPLKMFLTLAIQRHKRKLVIPNA